MGATAIKEEFSAISLRIDQWLEKAKAALAKKMKPNQRKFIIHNLARDITAIGGNAYALYKRYRHLAKNKAFDEKTAAEFRAKFHGLKKRFMDIEKMGDKETADIEKEEKQEKGEKEEDDEDDDDDDDEEDKKEEHKKVEK